MMYKVEVILFQLRIHFLCYECAGECSDSRTCFGNHFSTAVRSLLVIKVRLDDEETVRIKYDMHGTSVYA